MDDQVDNYNVWCLELDLNWECNEAPGCAIKVDHCCYFIGCSGAQWLDESLAEIMRSTDINSRITFIWLDIKNPREGQNDCHERWPANRRQIIRDAMVAGLGAANIYTKAEFQRDFEANGNRWPSWQNLQERGQKFILVLEDQIDGSGKNDDGAFFIAVKSLTEARRFPHAAFINVEGADLGREDPPKWNDRYIYRTWGADWNTAVSLGFNLIGTDDIDEPTTITDPRIHSPSPIYVSPFFNSDQMWGTKDHPIPEISSAIARATPGSTLRIRPWIYPWLWVYPQRYVFDKPVVLDRDPRYEGSVVIGARVIP